MRVDQEAGCE